MTDPERRFLGLAKLKVEGEPTSFDDGQPEYEGPLPRGYGLSMREGDAADGLRWYVVRHGACSSDIDDEEAAVWTLSRAAGVAGWETDSGADGYGLRYAEARELADAINERDG
jgi:hypothetical protein